MSFDFFVGHSGASGCCHKYGNKYQGNGPGKLKILAQEETAQIFAIGVQGIQRGNREGRFPIANPFETNRK
jgi:hypothetical protein